jgi:DNA-binding NtrC family response regulator|uniref:Response regulator n=1 Tax=Desulfobacca acetoxidans TaxID=60893 RepID=A0A7C3Z6P3_9BACT
MAATIVIVDDEPDILDLLKLILTEKTPHKILTTTDPRQALEWCQSQKADVLISDLRMPELEGIELLKIIQQIDPNLPIILITAYGTIESAVEAMRHKAFDYIAKPFRKEQILLTIDKALKWRQEQLGG